MKRIFTCLTLLLLLYGCKKDKPDTIEPEVKGTGISFTIDATKNGGKISANVFFEIDGTSVTGNTPEPEPDMRYAMSFTVPDGAVVKVDGVVQSSGVTVQDLSKPVTYTVENNGTTTNYVVTLVNFTGLPILYLTTDAPVVSKDAYVTGKLQVDARGQYPQDVTSMDLQVKGRGNSTWDMPKKPYRLKFNTKAKMLGLTAAKNWVLLANYSDKTLMRNYLAFNVAQSLKSDWAPHGIFVELFMNGAYQGNYTLTEQVEINPGRIDIQELKSADVSPTAITGGYVLELDKRYGEVVNWATDHIAAMNLRSPEAPTPAQLDYIKTYIQNTENAIFADNFADPVNGYAKYINSDSFINWFLVNELFKNQDAMNFASMFYFKDRNGKLGMGPAWDFDLGAGNVDYSDASKPQGWWVHDGLWMKRLFADPAFAAKVKARWTEMKATAIPQLYADIERNRVYLKYSAKQNFLKWRILGTYVWPNPVVFNTYDGEIDYVKKWFVDRVYWLDANIK